MGETVTVRETKDAPPPVRTTFKSNGNNNLEFPEIVTETETTVKVETTREKLIKPHQDFPSPTTSVLTKRVSLTTTKIRTTTPYTGTV